MIIKMAFILGMDAFFVGSSLDSNGYPGYQCHFGWVFLAKWRLYRLSLPLWLFLLRKVAFINVLSATFVASSSKSGVYQRSLCHFCCFFLEKWRLSTFSLPLLLLLLRKVAFTNALSATFDGSSSKSGVYKRSLCHFCCFFFEKWRLQTLSLPLLLLLLRKVAFINVLSATLLLPRKVAFIALM